jgi:hypothetical protein
LVQLHYFTMNVYEILLGLKVVAISPAVTFITAFPLLPRLGNPRRDFRVTSTQKSKPFSRVRFLCSLAKSYGLRANSFLLSGQKFLLTTL